MVKTLKPISPRVKDENIIAKEIFDILKKDLLQPLLDELEKNQKIYYNGLIHIKSALKSGKIGLNKGIVKGSFNSSIIKEFNELGFKFDKRIKGFRVDINKLPVTLQLEVGRSNLASKRLAESLLTKLDSVNIDETINNIDLNNKYLDILNNIDNVLIKDVAKVMGITITPNITQKEVIAKEFINNMQLFIKDFTENEIVKLRKKVEANVFEGIRAETLRDDIKKEFEVSKNKANFLAKQEISLLTSKYKETKYRELGIIKYRWSTSRDGRVREDHRELNNKVFSFNNPPIENKEKGSRANPGEAFGCRCVAIPIIEN
jgi:SPP1 gp7 family putative phage head morphogenesis protein